MQLWKVMRTTMTDFNAMTEALVSCDAAKLTDLVLFPFSQLLYISRFGLRGPQLGPGKIGFGIEAAIGAMVSTKI